MMAKTIAERRKFRELEARRDRLLESKQKQASDLAKVRAEIAHSKKTKKA
jgi:hypothetical protein